MFSFVYGVLSVVSSTCKILTAVEILTFKGFNSKNQQMSGYIMDLWHLFFWFFFSSISG